MTKSFQVGLASAAAVVLTAFDVAAVACFLGSARWMPPLGFVLHVAVGVAAGLLGARHLATTRPERAWLATLLGGMTIAAAPVGVLGVLAFVLVKAFPRPPAPTWCVARPIVPDGARLLAASQVIPTAVELREVLLRRTQESAERRLGAALSTRALAAREAISLLREALTDPNDEVRLFAFSRIDHFRTHLEAQGRDLESSLSQVESPGEQAPNRQATPEAAARLHHEVARSRCELAYLGLVDGAVRDHTLANAREHATRASELAPDLASSEWLLGRIALTLADGPRALHHFERALALGMAKQRVLPYVAEAAFIARRFSQVRASLREYGVKQADPVLLPIVEVWQ